MRNLAYCLLVFFMPWGILFAQKTPKADNNPLPLRKRPIWTHQLTTDQLLKDLSSFQWVLDPNTPFTPLQPHPPWHHPAISALVDRAKSQDETHGPIVDQLNKRLGSSGPENTNAAIALFFLGDRDRCLNALDRAVVDDSIPIPARVASLYCLADVPQRLDVGGLSVLLREWAPPQMSQDNPVNGSDLTTPTQQFPKGQALAEAVLYALIRRRMLEPGFVPWEDPDVGRFISTGPAELQRITAIGFSSQKWDPLPAAFVQLLANNFPQVRRTALAAICSFPSEAAARVCHSATSDQDLQTRIEATRLLVHFPSDETVQLLNRLFRSESGTLREACIDAAAGLGEIDLIRKGTLDTSQQVRSASARHFLKLVGDPKDSAFVSLMEDRDPAVQAEAIASLRVLPLRTAGPLLLDLLASNSQKVRSVSRATLGERWEPARDFPINAPAPFREDALLELRRQWPHEGPSPSADASVESTERLHRIEAETLSLVNQWPDAHSQRRQEIADQLVQLGTKVPVILDKYFERLEAYPSPEFVELVLARLDPVYQRIETVGKGSPSEISQATSWLKQHWQGKSLLRMEAVLLAESLRNCQEPVAWLGLASFLEQSAAQLAATLDRLAVRHHNKIVRNDAWRRMAERKDPGLVAYLREGLADESEEVRLAALTAAGAVDAPSLVPFLIDALRSPNPSQRLAAATGLHRQGDPRGTKELQRLAFDPNPHLRLGVCKVIDEHPGSNTHDELRILYRLLDDQKPEVLQAAISALEKKTGISHATDRFAQPVLLSEQAKTWRKSLHAELHRDLQAD